MKLKQILTENNEAFDKAVEEAKYYKDAYAAVQTSIKFNRQDPELEQIIITNNKESFRYSKTFGRFERYERYLIETHKLHQLVKYCINLGTRIPELEHWILNPETDYPYAANMYLREFPEARTPSKNVPVTLNNPIYGIPYAITDLPNTITDDQLKRVLELLCDNINIRELNNIDISRYYFEPMITSRLNTNRLEKITTTELKNSDSKRTKHFLNELGLYLPKNDFE